MVSEMRRNHPRTRGSALDDVTDGDEHFRSGLQGVVVGGVTGGRVGEGLPCHDS